MPVPQMISKFKLHFDFFEVRAKLTGKFNDTSAQQLMTERMKSTTLTTYQGQVWARGDFF
jgi:hypothetical protein